LVLFHTVHNWAESYIQGNHTGYGQWKGRKTTAEEIWDLYTGLRQSSLNNFSILVSGYIPNAEGVETVGKIGRDLKQRASTKPGSFFWVLDPVMGDQGRLYIPPDEVPAYKALLYDADLILPNQFEAELLSGTPITSTASIAAALASLHATYHIPHIIITSVRLPPSPSANAADDLQTLSIIGSTATSTLAPRPFRIDVPAFPVFFSGTGDMFAALAAFRLREAAAAAGVADAPRWVSADAVPAADLPLARAAARVLAAMQAVLGKTFDAYAAALPRVEAEARAAEKSGGAVPPDALRQAAVAKAAEVRVVRNVRDLVEPPDLEKYVVRPLEDLGESWSDGPVHGESGSGAGLSS